MTTNSVTLASLALLKARYDDVNKHDILDSFVCFAEICLARRNPDQFSPEDIKNWLSSDFGLNIPLPPVKLIVNRMQKRGIVTCHERLYYINKISCDPGDFDKNQAEMITHYRAICLGLQEFAINVLRKELTEDECELGLLHYIDEYSIECVASFRLGDIVPVRGSDPGHWRFIVSRFVNYISSKSPEMFKYFVTVITGRMLENALMASDLSGIGARFRNTTIYLDTPLILHLVGAVGKDNQIYSREIFSLFKDSGAEIKVFSHTLEETDYVLRNAEKLLEMRSGGHGNVIVALREEGMSPSDVILIRARLRNILSDEGFAIVQTPPYIEEYQIDQIALESEMEAANLHYRSDIAKRADINSVRSIYVLRKGTSPYRVEHCQALFLTTNAAFARAAYSYGKKYEEFQKVSPVVTDFSLTNIVWIKSPLKHPDLPMHLLLTNCYSVLKPSEPLWDRFLQELDKLRLDEKITPDQHQYLRYEMRVRDELLNLTLGDAEEISEQIIIQILERHEQELVLPIKEELGKSQIEYYKTLDMLTESETKVANVDTILNKIAHLANISIRFLLLSIAAGFLAYTSGILPSIHPSNLGWRIGTMFIASAAVILNIARPIFGFKFIDPINSSCLFIENKMLELLRMFFGLKNKNESSTYEIVKQG
ncbi:MAG: hypothetical protein ACYC6G_03420 [Desulfobaccales bacterium]